MTRRRITIGVSKLSENYANWLNRIHNGLEIIDFYTVDYADLPSRFQSVTGLLLTGGGDVDPGMYGRKEDLDFCRGLDTWRDKLEMCLIDLAFMFKIPTFGICRGLQMLNVARKGSLYPDIPAFVPGSLVHQDSLGDVYHMVQVDRHSELFRITGTAETTVNSSHHQAIREPGEDLITVASGPDGIIEAIELSGSKVHPFFMAVQWHPERMEFENPLSGLLGKAFVEAAGTVM